MRALLELDSGLVGALTRGTAPSKGTKTRRNAIKKPRKK
jgi:hypothetical protein